MLTAITIGSLVISNTVLAVAGGVAGAGVCFGAGCAVGKHSKKKVKKASSKKDHTEDDFFTEEETTTEKTEEKAA